MNQNEINAARSRLSQIYDPTLFKASAEVITKRLEQFLNRSAEGNFPTLPWQPPEKYVALAKSYLASAPASYGNESASVPDRAGELASTYLDRINQLHSPRYMGHQVPPPIPLTALFELISSLSNQGNGVYEMGPFATSIERAVIEKMAGLIGWEKGFEGVVIHGGSLANATAILAARSARYPDVWKKGLYGKSKRPAIIASADSHYSIARAGGIAGLGTDQVFKAPLDSERRMCPKELERRLEELENEGYDVFCIVASSGSTPTGAFDPLTPLSELAESRKIRLHVDGAHGGSVLFNENYAGLVSGIDRADTVTWDAHKMMFLPALQTYLFYRQGKDSFLPFDQEAPYLLDPKTEDPTLFDTALRTVECTRRAMSLSLWGAWSLWGNSLFSDLIEVTFDLAKSFHGLLTEAPDFDPFHQPQSNILCFRHLPKAIMGRSEAEISAFQDALRKRVLEAGNYYITRTKLDGKSVLRVVLINPATGQRHLTGLMEELRQKGREIL